MSPDGWAYVASGRTGIWLCSRTGNNIAWILLFFWSCCMFAVIFRAFVCCRPAKLRWCERTQNYTNARVARAARETNSSHSENFHLFPSTLSMPTYACKVILGASNCLRKCIEEATCQHDDRLQPNTHQTNLERKKLRNPRRTQRGWQKYLAPSWSSKDIDLCCTLSNIFTFSRKLMGC